MHYSFFSFKYTFIISIDILKSTPILTMDFTYLDYFNYYLREFCSEITANYPDFEKAVVDNYRPLLESKQCKNDLYAKCFVSKVNAHMDRICVRDATLFEAANHVDKDTGCVAGLFLIEGVDFIKLWACPHNSYDNQKAIWKYLQLLTIIGRKIIPNKAEVLELLNSVEGNIIQAPAKVEKTLLSPEEDLSDAGNKPDMFGLGGIADLAGMFMGGSGGGSGNLLGGIAGLLGGAAGGNGDAAGGFGEMVKSMGEIFSNIDVKKIAEDMQQAQSVGEQMAESMEAKDPMPNTTAASTSAEAQQQQPPNPMALFSDMAQEMAKTFNFDELEGDAKPENIGQAIGKLLSGENKDKMFNLVQKFGNKIQQQMATGATKPEDLLRQTTQMMGGAIPDELRKQAEQVARANPGMAEQLRKQQQKANAGGMTKERLRAKVAAKEQAASQQHEQDKQNK